MDKALVRASKFLSLVLRHEPPRMLIHALSINNVSIPCRYPTDGSLRSGWQRFKFNPINT